MAKWAFIFLFCFITLCAKGQEKITWNTLADVKFTDKYSEKLDAYYYYPHFGASVKKLEGQTVSIKGYMLVVDPKKNVYVLSQYPNSACFFCGNGGPESIIELKFSKSHNKFKMDQVVTITGEFKLNQDDIYQCNYILENARQ